MRRKLWYIILVVVIVITTMCIIPMPKQIELTDKIGAEYDEDGNFVGQTKITISGYMLTYLIRDTSLHVTVEIDGNDWMYIETTGDVIYLQRDSLYVSSLSYYNRQLNRMEGGLLWFRQDLSAVAITLGNEIKYVASTNENDDLNIVYAEFYNDI